MKKLILLFISLLTYSFSFGQEFFKRTCAFDEILKSTNKQYQIDDEALHNLLNDKANMRMEGNDTIYVINTVVHLVYWKDNAYQNLTDAYVQSQIDALNRDFNLLNSDSVNLRNEFIPFRGNAKIYFQLANTDPQGNPSTGITRKKTLTLGFNPLTEEHKKKDILNRPNYGGTPAWNVKKYLNIWVCDLNRGGSLSTGLLGGYAYPPANLEHWEVPIILGNDTIVQNNALNRGNLDGVTIDYRFFGQFNPFNLDSLGGSDVYGKGRACVHEVGHYFGLRHIWGDAIDTFGVRTPPGCEVDDFIDDTPNSFTAYANYFTRDNLCDTFVNSCNVPYPVNGIDYPDMFENYMDYSTDKCYNLFTLGQIDFMRYVLLTRRNGLIIDRLTSLPTGVTQVSAANNNIDLFPNPSTGKVFVRQNAGFKSDVQVKVYNLMGEIVYQKTVSAADKNFDIDLSGKAASIYMINFTADGITTSEKIILE